MDVRSLAPFMSAKRSLFEFVQRLPETLTQSERLQELVGYGCQLYERRGVVAGVVFAGKKYRLTTLGVFIKEMEALPLSRSVCMRKA